MPWESTEHECERPVAGRRGIGSIWRCRRCGARWELTHKRNAGAVEYTRWRELPKIEPRVAAELASISRELAEHGDPPS